MAVFIHILGRASLARDHRAPTPNSQTGSSERDGITFRYFATSAMVPRPSVGEASYLLIYIGFQSQFQ